MKRVIAIIIKPNIAPINGERTIKRPILSIPVEINAPEPCVNQTGPISPPINAWDTLIGIPNFVQVYTQITDPHKADKII
ncbi:hypothetical protein SDC9_186610 [bioreactor metagenome]|uniref:Uncharacterized protein n=1 Tax=bioreactor metagenome TaxID=1076179 RepID=A0A645HSF8_9ZZZZ